MENATVYKINPHYAAAWLSPSRLRFGFSAPQVMVEGISSEVETLLSALLIGASQHTLERMCKRTKLEDGAVSELLMLLQPVLQTAQAGADFGDPQWCRGGVRFHVDPAPTTDTAAQQTAHDLSRLLEANGHVRDEQQPEVVICLNRYLTSQMRSRDLSTDAPQLPVLFSDSEIIVGPIVNSRGFPCARCIEAGRLRDDAEKPLLAKQLFHRAPASETLAGLQLVTPLVSQLLANARNPGEYGWRSTDPLIRYRFNLLAPRPILPEVKSFSGHSDCLCHVAAGEELDRYRTALS